MNAPVHHVRYFSLLLFKLTRSRQDYVSILYRPKKNPSQTATDTPQNANRKEREQQQNGSFVFLHCIRVC